MRIGLCLLLVICLGCVRMLTSGPSTESIHASPPPAAVVIDAEASPAGEVAAEARNSQWEIHQPQAPPPTISDRLYELEQADKAAIHRLDNVEYALHDTIETAHESESLLAVHEVALRALMEGTKETSHNLLDVTKAVAELTDHQNETLDILSKLVTDRVPQEQLAQNLKATAPNGRRAPQDALPKQVTAWGAAWCPGCITWDNTEAPQALADGWAVDHQDMTREPLPGPLPRFRVQIGTMFVDQAGYMTHKRLKEIERAILEKMGR